MISQAQTARNSTWYNIYEVSDPDASTITVDGLIPFMQYKLRLIANNVVGASQPSEPTKEFQTIQAPPSHPPRNVTVRAMSATELRVRWIVSIIERHLMRNINMFVLLQLLFCCVAAVAANRMVRKSTRVQRHVYGSAVEHFQEHHHRRFHR